MTLKKTHKKKKVKKMRGTSTHGGGARKKRKKSGHKGGVGMSGSGKRADHKKTLITKLYGHNYFGKRGITSKKTQKDKRKRINVDEIESNIERYLEKKIAKKTPRGMEINLKEYKILGGKRKIENLVKEKLIITAKEFSSSALEKVKEKGGKILISKNINENKT